MFILSKRTNQYAICHCKAFSSVSNLDSSSRVLAKVSIWLTYFAIEWTLLKKHTLFLVLENSDFATDPSSFLHGEPDLPRFCCAWIWFMSRLGLVLERTGSRDTWLHTEVMVLRGKETAVCKREERLGSGWNQVPHCHPCKHCLSYLHPDFSSERLLRISSKSQ